MKEKRLKNTDWLVLIISIALLIIRVSLFIFCYTDW